MPDPSATKPFAGAALPLTAADWPSAAARLGTDEAAVRAVAEVEAPGGGFLPDRRPKILFEAHIFSRLTGHVYDRSHPNISSPRWNRALYAGGAGEFDRLQKAIALDRQAALMAASWGRFQILGENYRRAGHSDVESFVSAMCASERAQLDAFISFVNGNHAMLTAIRIHDWPAFARSYNGPLYNQNHYDTKLGESYKKFRALQKPQVPETQPGLPRLTPTSAHRYA